MSFKKNSKLRLKHAGEGFFAEDLGWYFLWDLLCGLVALPVFLLGEFFGLPTLLPVQSRS